ncbi:MAG TPA: LptE family protein [Pirellulales bacterium]
MERCSSMRRRFTAALVTGLLAALGGCRSPYRLGSQTLYRCDIHTVHVPIFESTSFRRQLGERLTEAVVKEIEQRTPFKVVGPQDADTVLVGRITNDVKRVLTVTPTDEPRDLEVRLRVEATWTDRATNKTVGSAVVPISSSLAVSERADDFLPETGQSFATASQETINRIAQQIVSMMEEPW